MDVEEGGGGKRARSEAKGVEIPTSAKKGRREAADAQPKAAAEGGVRMEEEDDDDDDDDEDFNGGESTDRGIDALLLFRFSRLLFHGWQCDYGCGPMQRRVRQTRTTMILTILKEIAVVWTVKAKA